MAKYTCINEEMTRTRTRTRGNIPLEDSLTGAHCSPQASPTTPLTWCVRHTPACTNVPKYSVPWYYGVSDTRLPVPMYTVPWYHGVSDTHLPVPMYTVPWYHGVSDTHLPVPMYSVPWYYGVSDTHLPHHVFGRAFSFADLLCWSTQLSLHHKLKYVFFDP